MQARFMSAFGAFAAVILVIVGIAAIGWGVYKQPGVVGTFATAAAAVIAVVYQRDRENRRETEARHREQLAPMYEDLFVRFNEGFDAEKPEDLAFLTELQRKLLFYGSTPVIQRWLGLMRFAGDDDGSPGTLLRWEEVLFAIRKDLGHKDEGLIAGDLLRLYVPDADEHVALWLAEHPDHGFRRR